MSLSERRALVATQLPGYLSWVSSIYNSIKKVEQNLILSNKLIYRQSTMATLGFVLFTLPPLRLPRPVHLQSISSTYLRTAFTPIAPKSVRIQSRCQYLFTLLGSTGAKAARRMLMKLTPVVNFISMLRLRFFGRSYFYLNSCISFVS